MGDFDVVSEQFQKHFLGKLFSISKFMKSHALLKSKIHRGTSKDWLMAAEVNKIPDTDQCLFYAILQHSRICS